MVRIVDAKPETEVEYEANEVDAELESVQPLVGKSSAQPPMAPQVVRLTRCCYSAGRCAEGEDDEDARNKWKANWDLDDSGIKCAKYPCLTLVAKHGIDQCQIYDGWLLEGGGESAFSQTVYYIQ